MQRRELDSHQAKDSGYLEDDIVGSDSLALKIAEKYEKMYSVKHIYDRHSGFIIQFLKLKKVERILDLGCGMGNFLVKAQDAFSHLYGIDPGPRSCEIARRLLPKADLRIGKGEYLPFDNNFFDAVVMKGVVHHLKDPVVVFREVSRCLKGNGVVVVFEGNRSSIYRRAILGIADSFRICHESTPFEHRPPRIIIKMLVEAGLEIFHFENISGLFTPLALSALGGPRIWAFLDAIEDVLQKRFPFLFNYHVLIAAGKPGGRSFEDENVVYVSDEQRSEEYRNSLCGDR